MAKPTVTDKAISEMMPEEITALRALVKEFMDRISNVDNEIELLKQDRKAVIDDYSEKLDMKTLQTALRVIKLQNSVARKDAYDLFIEALSDPTTGGVE